MTTYRIHTTTDSLTQRYNDISVWEEGEDLRDCNGNEIWFANVTEGREADFEGRLNTDQTVVSYEILVH